RDPLIMLARQAQRIANGDLGKGETKVETFVVKSLDGTEHTVTITITGVN
ncbi:VCBS domain-containing protein, partial [Aeromonas salmonicida]